MEFFRCLLFVCLFVRSEILFIRPCLACSAGWRASLVGGEAGQDTAVLDVCECRLPAPSRRCPETPIWQPPSSIQPGFLEKVPKFISLRGPSRRMRFDFKRGSRLSAYFRRCNSPATRVQTGLRTPPPKQSAAQSRNMVALEMRNVDARGVSTCR